MGRRFRFSRADDDIERISGRVFRFTDGSLTLAVEIGSVDGVWQPVGFDVRAYGPKGQRKMALTARELRRIPFGALVDRARGRLRKQLEAERVAAGPISSLDEEGHQLVNFWATAVHRGLKRLDAPRPGRPSLPLDQLQRDAEKFIELQGLGRQPTKDLAAHIGITPSGASKRIRRARDLGLIPPARGRPGRQT